MQLIFDIWKKENTLFSSDLATCESPNLPEDHGSNMF